MESTAEFKFGKQVLPRDDADADRQALKRELGDTFLQLDDTERTDALRRWASGPQRAESSEPALRYISRHRWCKSGDAWVDNYDVDDLLQREQFIGKPELQSLQQQIAVASTALQRVMRARALQAPGDSDAQLQEQQGALQQHLALLLSQQEHAAQDMLTKLGQVESQSLDALGEVTEELITEKGATSKAPVQQQREHRRGLNHAAVSSAAIGLVCGVGISRFLPRLLQRKHGVGRSLLGLAAIAVVSAATLVVPGSASDSNKQKDVVPVVGDAAHVNLLLLESSESVSS